MKWSPLERAIDPGSIELLPSRVPMPLPDVGKQRRDKEDQPQEASHADDKRGGQSRDLRESDEHVQQIRLLPSSSRRVSGVPNISFVAAEPWPL